MTDPETYNRVVTIGVDVQNDFCPGGLLGVEEGDQVVTPLNNVTEWTRHNNGTVVFTRDRHPEQTSHFNVWPVHCVAGTTGADLHKDVAVEATDRVLDKGTGPNEDAYSGFDATDQNNTTLEDLITPLENERVAVLIGGLATDYCIKATVLDACGLTKRDYPVVPHRLAIFVIEDAIKAVNINPEDEKRAIDEMKINGAQFVTSQQILEGMIRVKEQ